MQLENPQVDEPAPAATGTEGQQPANPAADPAPAAPNPSDSQTRKDPVQGRIDEITRKRRVAERERDYWKNLAMRNGHQPERTEKPTESQPQGRKKLADFDYDEEKYDAYVFDLAKEHARTEANATFDKRFSEYEKTQAAKRRESAFIQREREFAKQNQDYFNVVHDPSNTFFNDVIGEAIMDSDEGPAIAFYLANNLDVAEKLPSMSPYAAAREIGRIEAMLIAERKKPPERVASQAPPPPPKIEASADAALPKSLDDPNMSDAEWNKLRRKQLEAKRKR